jgi:hypothetical protein
MIAAIEPLAERSSVICQGRQWIAHRHDRYGRHWSAEFDSKGEAEAWLVELAAGAPSTRSPVPKRSGSALRRAHLAQPCSHEGVAYASFVALARHLAPSLGKSQSAIARQLTKFAGDVGKVIEFYRSPPPALQCENAHPAVYNGIEFPSQTALGRYLSGIIPGHTPKAIAHQLRRFAGDVDKVIAFYAGAFEPTAHEPPAAAEESRSSPDTDLVPVAQAGTSRSGNRGSAKSCHWRGIDFPSRRALIEHLAALTGHPELSVNRHLYRFGGDVERAIAFLHTLSPGQPPPSPQPPFRYDGHSFPSKNRLADYLAAKTGHWRGIVAENLRFSDGDIPKLVELLRSLPVPERPPATPVAAAPVASMPSDLDQALARIAHMERQHSELVGELHRLGRQQRLPREILDRLQHRVVAIERHVGLVEAPQAPRPTRRRPLEA